MSKLSSYGEYASGEYLEYQKKYAAQIRESDRVIIEMVRDIVKRRGEGRPMSLVDIGCSSGNLLYHLKRQVPGLELHGGDAFPGIIEACRQNPELEGISFDQMDLLDLDGRPRFDIVIVNAVLFLFPEPDFDRAIVNIASVTKGGGHFITFDLFHPAEQELSIIEKSETHPEGLKLHFRPFSSVRMTLEKHGFINVFFKPFLIPIDLSKPKRAADISSHTVRTENGERLIFRGALFTPWCHVLAEKG
jgi:SAM-dependent methyltransferase